MKRKVIQIAGSTQLVSLPRQWALKNKLNKGDEVEVTEEGNMLKISTGKALEKGSVEADITGLDRDSLMFFIRALYKNGYDEILINFKESKVNDIRKGESLSVMEVISKEVSRLNGLEIFNQKSNMCLLKNLSEETSKDFDNILRRVFILTLEIMDDLRKGYKAGDRDILETIQSKHDTITRFVSYSQRLLHKTENAHSPQTDSLYYILEVIDQLVDYIKYSARDLLKMNLKASKEAIKIYDNIYDAFELFYQNFYKFDFKNISSINEMRHNIIKLIEKSTTTLPKRELIILSHIEQVLDKVMNLSISTMSYRY